VNAIYLIQTAPLPDTGKKLDDVPPRIT
jgi:hypothetical protein